MEFFAIVADFDETQVVTVPIEKPVQDELKGIFEQQAADFLDPELERIPFASTYGVDTDEIFQIERFNIPEAITKAIRSPTGLDPLKLDGAKPHTIKAIMAGEMRGTMPLAYIQSFSRMRLLSRGYTLLHEKRTYTKLEVPGLTLDTKLSAAIVDGSLLFRNYATVSQFLNLYQYFHAATNPEIKEVISSKMFQVEDKDALLGMCDQPMRKRFSAIRASGVLDTISLAKCKSAARKVSMSLPLIHKGTSKERIAFPTEKKEIKELLHFLTEDIYPGPLTGHIHKSNSHRLLTNGQPQKPKRRRRRRSPA